MRIVRTPRLGLVGGLFCMAVVAVPQPSQAQAQAQSCHVTHGTAFARLNSLENRATTQDAADLEVRALFGPRVDLCEEGAYKAFMQSFFAVGNKALRSLMPSRDPLLRLTIASLGHAPIRVSAKEWKEAASIFRQVRNDLSAAATDVGLHSAPLFLQLLETFGRIGIPTADQPATPPGASRQALPAATGPGTTGAGTGNVQQVRIPTEPLPPWAVIRLYELRDRIKAQDYASSQTKIQDVLNWIEGKAPASP